MANKKYSVLAVLRVLEDYSDEEHSLYIKEIQGLIESEYGIVVGEKTIRTDIRALLDFGFDIRFVGSYRRVVAHKDGTVIDSDINTGCYLVGSLTDVDIEILFSSLTNERHLSDTRYKELMYKLEGLSSTNDFRLFNNAVLRGKRDIVSGDIVYENIHVIKEAIKGRKVLSLTYLPSIGEPPSNVQKEMLISPYRVFVEDNVYYLVGSKKRNWWLGGELVFLRIERMRKVEILPYEKYSVMDIMGGKKIGDDYDKGRFRLCLGQSIEITFRYSTSIFDKACDYFGKRNMSFAFFDESFIESKVSVPEKAMVQFALMNAPDVEIMDPPELRKKVKNMFTTAAKKNS